MAKAEIYQIYYSEETRLGLDPGFVPLDNLSDERPDWREYWTFRRFLLSHTLEAETYYGFFSPKFRSKTGLDSAAVYEFIERQGGRADVIAFSPFFQDMAYPLNIMEQAVLHHGSAETFAQSAALIAPDFRLDQSTMNSANTIYCNYFVAKRDFWSEWLRQGERLFQIAEEGLTPLAQALNGVVTYGVRTAPAKTFVIERLASLLLWAQPRWTVRSYSPLLLPSAADISPDFVVLDALKIAHAQTGAERYLDIYKQLRGRMAARYGAPATHRPNNPGLPSRAEQAAARGPAVAGAPEKIRVVCATRRNRDEFFTHTALGKSLSLFLPPAVEVRLSPGGNPGLPNVYNSAILEARHDPAILLFIHDDVHLCDYFWADRLREAMRAFDIVGLAGNRRRVSGQPSWLFVDQQLSQDRREHLSGVVGHGRGHPPDLISAFGPSGQEVKLLDGLFLAGRSETLHSKSLCFDERFDFHFYDLDFCRQAERLGLKIGTWPIAVIHESSGDFTGEAWRRGYARYLEKWRD